MLLLFILTSCNRFEVPILVNNWCDSPREAVVTAVIDGDTIDLEGGERVRLLGVDAPEVYYDGHDDCSTQDSTDCCFGLESEDWLTNALPAGTTIRLEFDLDCYGIYDRTLAYMWIVNEDDPDDEIFINEELLKEGYARVYDADVEQAQDIRYLDSFKESQLLAQSNSAGLWGECY
jgi:micrococcal nuclease